jgi:hypothetical protein
MAYEIGQTFNSVNEDDKITLNRFQRIITRKLKGHSLLTPHNSLLAIRLNVIKDDFLLNGDTSGGARQENPSTTINSSGNVVITWTDFRDGNADIYCQRFDDIGNMIGSNFRINSDKGMMWQGEPSIASDNQNNFVAAWEDRRFFNSDVYVQKFNSQGLPIDTNFRANDNTGTSDQRSTSTVILPNKNFIVVWDDWRDDWGDIYGQRFDSSGNFLGSNFRINDDTPGSNQYSPSIACDSLGNFVVTWMDGRQGSWDIYAQQYNNQGINIGINFRVNDDGGNTYQSDPSVSRTHDGQFIITWEDQRQGNSDIYCQRFDANGNRLGSNFKVNNDNGTATQVLPDVSVDNNDNFVITWTDNRNNNFDIFVQLYNSNGTPIGQNFKANDDLSTQDQSEPSIAMYPLGNFWIVWKDHRNVNSDIFSQRYSSSGIPIGNNVRINDDYASSHQRCSWITQDGLGNYRVTWEDERNNNCDIYGVCMDSLGNIIGSDFRVNDDITTADQYYASDASSFTGNFIITWTDGRNNNFDIYAQRYSNTGIPIGNNFLVNSDTAQAVQWYPVASCDSIGNTVIVWMDYRNDGNDIYGQLYHYQGNPISTNFMVNQLITGSQLYPYVARNRNGNFVVVWMDDRNGNYDIFAQQYDNIGNPISSNFIVNDNIGTSFQGYPAVAIDNFSNYYIVWEDERNGNTDIYMQRYNCNGTPLGSNFRVDDDNTGFDQYSPTIACDETGKFIVVWCDFRNGDDDPEIYAQAFLADGTLLGTNQLINQPDLFPANNQWLIGQGIVANSRRTAFAWIDNRRHQGWDIYSKIVDWNYFTGVNEESEKYTISQNSIRIFPNPTAGKIFLNTNGHFTGDITFFNSAGRKIKTVQLSTESGPWKADCSIEINLSQFSNGIYFVLYNIKGQIETRKIIINKLH